MAWIIVTLICAGSLFAQPFGPFLIADAGPPTVLGEAKVVVDATGTAHVFYERNDSGARYIMYTALDAATGNVVTEPVAVCLALTEFLFLEDVAITESGVPKILVFTADPGDYNLILVEASGSDWTATLLFHDQDGWSPEYGVLPHSFHDCRFVAAADDYTQVCLCNTMRISGPLLTTVAMPVVCFVGATGDVSALLLQSSTQMIFGSLRSRSLGADSMYLWAPGDVLDFYKFVVRSDGTYEQLADYDHNSCYYGELAGMSVNGGDQIHVNNTALCIPTCLTFERISGDSCAMIGETYVFPPMYPPTSFAAYENHGFVFPIRDENEVQLLRVDTNATVAASVGTIGWRDGAVQITHAASGVSSNGEIAVVWRDHDPASSAQRLWLASCDWLTPLESRDAPTPVPQEISLSAYPNPFNSAVRIDYDLPRASDVRLSVFNTLGQEVSTLVNERVSAGAHALSWSPTGASGVYLVRLVSNDVITSKKVLYIR